MKTKDIMVGQLIQYRTRDNNTILGLVLKNYTDMYIDVMWDTGDVTRVRSWIIENIQGLR